MTLSISHELSGGYGTAIAYSTRENLWVTVAAAQFHIWRDRELLYSVPLNGQDGGNPSFSADGRRLYVGTRIFDLAQREFVAQPPLEPALLAGLPPGSNARVEQFEINGSAWSSDGDVLVIHAQYRAPRDPRVTAKYTGPWKRLLLLNGSTREAIATLAETNRSEENTAIVIGDRFIAAAGLSVLAWSRADLARIAELEGFNVSFRDLRLSSDGSLLAAPAWDGHVATWDTRSWQRTGAWKAHEDYARCVAFHPQRPILATGGGDTTLKLWSSAAPGEMIESLNLAAKVEAVCFWADGAGITVALEDGRLVLCSYEA